MDIHRISLELRSGIWLMFYETRIRYGLNEGYYKQQLLWMRRSSFFIKPEAEAERIRRGIDSAVIIRDDSYKNKMLRPA